MDTQTQPAYPSDEVIDGYGTQELRAAATHFELASYMTRRTVLNFDIDESIFKTGGTLTAVDKFVQALMAAYRTAGLGPVVGKDYGSMTISVWTDDSTLRMYLKREGKIRREAAAETEPSE